MQYQKSRNFSNSRILTLSSKNEVFSGQRLRVPEYKIKSEITDSSNNTYTIKGIPYAVWMTGVLEMWKKGVNGKGVTIGVIDNGVDVNHPALKLTTDGRRKVIREVNVSGVSNPSRDHGTLVAGLIAGYELHGYKGCAPNAQIISYVVVDGDGTASDSTLARAIDLAVAQGCQIINISMGGEGGVSSGLKAAIDRAWSKGVLLVCSSGNSGPNSTNYPANYEKCVSVAGIEYNAQTGSITVSNFASTNTGVDVTAVATDVTVCDVGGGYAIASGTSFSCPIISGLAALLRHEEIRNTFSASNRMIAVDEQKLLLIAHTMDLFDLGQDKQSGHGLVSFYQEPAVLKTYGTLNQ